MGIGDYDEIIVKVRNKTNMKNNRNFLSDINT